jgi:hypothetical protein
MEGISTSPYMFDTSKRSVFHYDDLIGTIGSEDGKDFTVEPVNKPARIVTGEENAIQYLIDNKARKAVIQQIADPAQLAFF